MIFNDISVLSSTIRTPNGNFQLSDDSDVVLTLPSGKKISMRALEERLDDIEARLEVIECSRDFEWSK